MSKFKDLYMLSQEVYDFEHAFLQAVREANGEMAVQWANHAATLYRALSAAERKAAQAVCELKPHEAKGLLS